MSQSGILHSRWWTLQVRPCNIFGKPKSLTPNPGWDRGNHRGLENTRDEQRQISWSGKTTSRTSGGLGSPTLLETSRSDVATSSLAAVLVTLPLLVNSCGELKATPTKTDEVTFNEVSHWKVSTLFLTNWNLWECPYEMHCVFTKGYGDGWKVVSLPTSTHT